MSFLLSGAADPRSDQVQMLAFLSKVNNVENNIPSQTRRISHLPRIAKTIILATIGNEVTEIRGLTRRLWLR